MKIRASYVVGACVLFALPAVANETVSYASYGGAYQEGVRKAILDHLPKDHGMDVKEYTLQSGITDIRTRVKGGANEIDVAELYGGYCKQAGDEGLLEKLDFDKIPNAAGIPEKLRSDYAIGFTAYSTVIAYNKDVYKDNPPKDWADFFDTKKFPGSRAVSGYSGQSNLEAALLADGVSRDKLYPLDVDKAFKKLEQLKPDISVFWDSGAQATQLATSQEVDMMTIWAARIEAAIKEGAPYAYTLNQGLVDVECLVVPKGSPNKEGAMRLINHLLDPHYQANLPDFIPYGPMNQDAFKQGLIPPEKAAKVVTSTENLAKQVFIDAPYWAGHATELQERWDKFKQQ
ncbi:ABC transporter substrate-binding protein [Rhizobium sp. RAF56]|jgi:putative spermidine/putrescine transport system substrate-binding protein|uniref:ABC transporter substrate-binding protein n=1 Tax=Rhizobium sp. RAF56 TaxID=3233062 RepID=UPI003F9D2A2D